MGTGLVHGGLTRSPCTVTMPIVRTAMIMAASSDTDIIFRCKRVIYDLASKPNNKYSFTPRAWQLDRVELPWRTEDAANQSLVAVFFGTRSKTLYPPNAPASATYCIPLCSPMAWA